MSPGWRGEKGWGDGCVRRIMRLTKSWARRGLIVEGGRNGGGGMRGRVANFGESWGFSEPYGEGRERGVLVPYVYSKGYKGTEMMKSVRIYVLGSKR